MQMGCRGEAAATIQDSPSLFSRYPPTLLHFKILTQISFILIEQTFPDCKKGVDNSLFLANRRSGFSRVSVEYLIELTDFVFCFSATDSKPKSGDGYGNNVDSENGDSKFAKQVSLGFENIVREKCKTKIGAECNTEALSSPKGTQDSEFSPTYTATDDSSNDNSDSVTLTMSNDIAEKSSDTGDNASSVMGVADALMDNCTSIVSNSKCSGLCKNDCCDGGEKCQYEKTGQTSDVAQSIPLYEGLVTVVRGNDEKDLDDGNLASNKLCYANSSRLPGSHGCSKSHEFEKLERCTTLKGDNVAGLNVGDDFLKGCSCSFCLKAAHILSDLQYQDIKGRISALKKSQKEANIFVEKSFRGKEIDTEGWPHPNKTSKLEYDLSSQWRSLFLHVEDMLVHESNHLQDSYVTLKDLRDNCKTELEMTSGMPSEKQ
ncbi:hypothetical protein L3X38_033594 [Prunus dulcis]|uniref:Uncharacterized protein n=1 Tax=Prunus dulcis TaxID=3755 RepID=A0AAD4VHA4_PRUDU|nr:hypothetical protein L3X38_033594 [Prunus dulcis]